MLVRINSEFFDKKEHEIAEYIGTLTHETAKACILAILAAHKDSILLVEFDQFIDSIWMYQKNGIAICVDLPYLRNEGFRCGFNDFTGMKSLYTWPGKAEGDLPF
ncbi:hypothetical protein WMO40_21000 [Bacillaceae bacterium CLA-AA-H227]|uniref:Uncharacterized protein n=1 Tax=Robertmurraya yapensis (ex Hitch et al 2024) TaxID=3133160 RepID=A0ACC6SGJ1_9BACI